MPTEPNNAENPPPAGTDPFAFHEEKPPPASSRRGHRRWRDSLHKLFEVIRDTRPPPEQQAHRLRTVEQNIVLPVKLLLVAIVSFYVFAPVTSPDTAAVRPPTPAHAGGTNGINASPSSTNSSLRAEMLQDRSNPSNEAFSRGYRSLRYMLIGYILMHFPVAGILFWPRAFRMRLRHVQNIILVVSCFDAVFVSLLTYLTEGVSSIAYWLFPGLILRNTISLPLARPQLLLNVLTIVLYATAGSLDLSTNYPGPEPIGASLESALFLRIPAGHNPTEQFVMRIVLLILLTLCCYALQVLLEKQRQTEDDARELTTRQQQLDVAARLAAQIAHQIKNPLGIINNTIYNLERSVRTGKHDVAEQQLGMIREEVTRADQIITRLMGYAQLREGRVEKLDVIEEMERVTHEVFPPIAKYQTRIVKQYAEDLPALWMQRQHLADIFSNILTNAREALFGQGEIRIRIERLSDSAIRVVIADSGPGIPADRINQIFQPYFTTKEKGNGLGLAIVRQNMNLYGGAIRVESELGQGSRFILTFQVRASAQQPAATP
ncbi:MAG: hypothetical protein HY299_12625 [Verrucomicrobia bacterium]|nr:hypothetical protein [Verrucomicrobiota bacterium]